MSNKPSKPAKTPEQKQAEKEAKAAAKAAAKSAEEKAVSSEGAPASESKEIDSTQLLEEKNETDSITSDDKSAQPEAKVEDLIKRIAELEEENKSLKSGKPKKMPKPEKGFELAQATIGAFADKKTEAVYRLFYDLGFEDGLKA